jgi:hypothetical protein
MFNNLVVSLGFVSCYSIDFPQFSWGQGSIDAAVIHISPQLVDAPLSVLEHVVAHEIVHLLHRNHGVDFGKPFHASCQTGGCGRLNWHLGKAGVSEGLVCETGAIANSFFTLFMCFLV